MINKYTKVLVGVSIGLFLNSTVWAANIPTTPSSTTGPTDQTIQSTTTSPNTVDPTTDPTTTDTKDKDSNVNNTLKTLENKLKASQENKTSTTTPVIPSTTTTSKTSN